MLIAISHTRLHFDKIWREWGKKGIDHLRPILDVRLRIQTTIKNYCMLFFYSAAVTVAVVDVVALKRNRIECWKGASHKANDWTIRTSFEILTLAHLELLTAAKFSHCFRRFNYSWPLIGFVSFSHTDEKREKKEEKCKGKNPKRCKYRIQYITSEYRNQEVHGQYESEPILSSHISRRT